MPDYGKWKEFHEERTNGWKADHENGVPMEVWISYDEPNAFRVTVDNALEPDFYPDREAAFAAAEAFAAALRPARTD